MQSKLAKDDKMLEDRDSVMADCGFDVQDILAHKNVRLNASPSPGWQTSPPGERCREDTWNSRSVERSIGRARRYDIVNSHIPLTLAPIANEIVSVCFLLTNFDKPLVQK